MSLLQLPTELLLLILDHCDGPSLHHLSHTCTRMRELTTGDPRLWEDRFRRDYGVRVRGIRAREAYLYISRHIGKGAEGLNVITFFFDFLKIYRLFL